MMEKRKYGAAGSSRKSWALAAMLVGFGVLFLLVNIVTFPDTRQDVVLNISAIGREVGQAAGQVGDSIGHTAGELGQNVGEAAGKLGQRLGEAAGQLGESFGQTAGQFGQSIGDAFAGPAPRPMLPGWWPLLLIVVGLYLILRRPTQNTKIKHDDEFYEDDLPATHDIV